MVTSAVYSHAIFNHSQETRESKTEYMPISVVYTSNDLMKPNESTVSGYRWFECNSNGNKEGETFLEKNQSASTKRAFRYKNAHGINVLQCTVVG